MNRSGDLICHFHIWIALIGRTKCWASLFVFRNAIFEGLAVKVELFYEVFIPLSVVGTAQDNEIIDTVERRQLYVCRYN